MLRWVVLRLGFGSLCFGSMVGAKPVDLLFVKCLFALDADLGRDAADQSFAASFAHESLSVTVLLKTSCAGLFGVAELRGWESGSMQK